MSDAADDQPGAGAALAAAAQLLLGDPPEDANVVRSRQPGRQGRRGHRRGQRHRRRRGPAPGGRRRPCGRGRHRRRGRRGAGQGDRRRASCTATYASRPTPRRRWPPPRRLGRPRPDPPQRRRHQPARRSTTSTSTATGGRWASTSTAWCSAPRPRCPRCAGRGGGTIIATASAWPGMAPIAVRALLPREQARRGRLRAVARSPALRPQGIRVQGRVPVVRRHADPRQGRRDARAGRLPDPAGRGRGRRLRRHPRRRAQRRVLVRHSRPRARPLRVPQRPRPRATDRRGLGPDPELHL